MSNCTSCTNTASAGTGKSEDNTPDAGGFTYNEGKGIKDKLVLSGPLSAVLREALNQHFSKKAIVTPTDSGDIDNALDNAETLAPATESQAQDLYLAEMIRALEKTPGTDVVLHDFDYEANAKHVDAVTNGKPINQAERDPELIPVYVARAEDLQRPDTFDSLAYASDLNVICVGGVDTESGDDKIQDQVNTIVIGNGVAKALKRPDEAQINDHNDESNLVKVAALERHYDGTGVRLFFGVESFVQHLVRTRQKKD